MKRSTHLRRQVLSRGQMLEPEEAVPVPRPAPAGVVLDHLHLPQCLAAGGGRGGRPARGAQKHVLLLLVLVPRQELLLLGVEETDHVTLSKKTDGQ